MVRVLVIDDEALARQRLVRLVSEIPGYSVVSEANSIASGRSQMLECDPDIVLLDIRMPDGEGIHLVRKWEGRIGCIFVTAHADYAAKAYQLGADGYILKPVSRADLEQALQRVKKIRNLPSPRSEQTATDERIAVPTTRGMRFIPVREIFRLSVNDKYVCVSHNGEEHLLESSLSQMEARLTEHNFCRVHRRELVNLTAIKDLNFRKGAPHVILHDGQQVAVSRRLLPNLKKKLRLDE